MSIDQPRTPAGSPTGGQYAGIDRPESDVDLSTDDARTCSRCGDETTYLSSDDLCDGCTQEDAREAHALRALGSSLQHFEPHGVDQMLVVQLGNLERARHDRQAAVDNAHRCVGDRQDWRSRAWARSNKDTVEALERLAEHDDSHVGLAAARALDELTRTEAARAYEQRRVDVFDAEYERRGGWTRAFLATSSDGHVHSSMSCSTCNKGGRATTFQLMTQYSGGDEQSVVADAGYRACTVCYPSAPVGDATSLPTKIFSDDERAARKARAEREEQAAQRKAAKIAKALTPDGSPLQVTYLRPNAGGWDRDPVTGARTYVHRDRTATESFATERTAVTWWTDHHDWVRWDSATQDWEPKPGVSANYVPALKAIEEAYAAKHGLSVPEARNLLADKAAAKARRQGR